MPATKNKKVSPPKRGKRPSPTKSTKQNEEKAAANRQLAAIILFAVSVFFICLSFINGGGLWGGLRTLSFGLFGFSAFIWPLVLIYVAVMATLDKTDQKIGVKIFEAAMLIILLSAAIHIFGFHGIVDFSENVIDAYNAYRFDGSLVGSGAVGAIIGGAILLATGSSKPAAIAIILILMFLFLMLMTGTTLKKLMKGVYSPVKKVSEYREEKLEQLASAEERNRESFNPDVDLGPEPVTEKSAKKSKKTADIVQVDNVDKKESNEAETNELTESKPVLLDDIIKKMNGDEANSQISKPIEEAAKSSASASALKSVKGTLSDDENDKPKAEYQLPSLDCLAEPKNGRNVKYEDELKANATKLVDTLKSFGVETRIVDISRGPSVTRYEIQPAAGVKISRITNLSDDIALNLAASGVRIEAPIPNKAAVGIEVPNKNRSTVTLREIIDTDQYRNAKSKLFVALGKDIAGNCTYADLAKMPHLLVAGTTGSGKSVCLNSMIVSILYNAKPDEVKLLMIDPKQVEFTVYNGIPHLIVPVVSDPRKASGALAWAVTEMLSRYKTFSDNNVRDISGYNSICESIGQKKMPQIVIFIDELSDLMMAAPHEVEDSICRLAQMARAAGMHLVIATQRPSVDVITGLIKANIPSRIAFAVSSQVDSRTILDSQGAEKLLGKGDMLFFPQGLAKPIRVQGAFVSDGEVARVTDFIKEQYDKPAYDESINDKISQVEQSGIGNNSGQLQASDSEDDGRDAYFAEAGRFIIEKQKASIGVLQRVFKIGFNRGARIMDQLAEAGVVSEEEGKKPRNVLMTLEQFEQYLNNK